MKTEYQKQISGQVYHGLLEALVGTGNTGGRTAVAGTRSGFDKVSRGDKDRAGVKRNRHLLGHGITILRGHPKILFRLIQKCRSRRQLGQFGMRHHQGEVTSQLHVVLAGVRTEYQREM